MLLPGLTPRDEHYSQEMQHQDACASNKAIEFLCIVLSDHRITNYVGGEIFDFKQSSLCKMYYG